MPVPLEGEPYRVLELSIAVRLTAKAACILVQELGTRNRIRSIEADTRVRIPILWVIEEIEGIHPELRLNPLRYVEVLRHREVRLWETRYSTNAGTARKENH